MSKHVRSVTDSLLIRDGRAHVAGLGQLDAVTKIMNVGILLLSPSCQLEFANGLASELLGFACAEDLKNDWDRIGPLLNLDERLIDAAKPRPLKVDVPTRDGVRFLRLETYVLDEDFCSGYLVLLRDRRMVHVLENDLLLASQMRAQNYLYGALIHDLRAPLNAMQITVELLGGANGPDARSVPRNGEEISPERHITVLREELARLNRTLRSVLDYGAPLDPELKEFDLLAVVREIVTLLTPQAGRQRADIRLGLPSQSVVLVCGQRDRIKQALLNVAINGLEALPKTGGVLKIDVEKRGDSVEIIFTDSGTGVPHELLDTIYQVYFTTKKAGSGLGLYVARLVLESHGGDIRVENIPNDGARFCLSLPAR